MLAYFLGVGVRGVRVRVRVRVRVKVGVMVGVKSYIPCMPRRIHRHNLSLQLIDRERL